MFQPWKSSQNIDQTDHFPLLPPPPPPHFKFGKISRGGGGGGGGGQTSPISGPSCLDSPIKLISQDRASFQHRERGQLTSGEQGCLPAILSSRKGGWRNRHKGDREGEGGSDNQGERSKVRRGKRAKKSAENGTENLNGPKNSVLDPDPGGTICADRIQSFMAPCPEPEPTFYLTSVQFRYS